MWPFPDLQASVCPWRALEKGQEHPPVSLGRCLGPGGGADGQADRVAVTQASSWAGGEGTQSPHHQQKANPSPGSKLVRLPRRNNSCSVLEPSGRTAEFTPMALGVQLSL